MRSSGRCFSALLLHLIAALDNGVGLTPAMGYNTWDDFRCGGINASNVRKVADAIVRDGLDVLGYRYLGLDDCWAKSRDAATGEIVPDPVAFPDGMKAVADYVHSKGLLFGLYTDRGTATCVGRPGSQGFERQDAATFAAWGVDLLKEDSCSAPTDHNASLAQYALMRDALNATGRPIYFALCGWSSWYAPVGKTLGNSWRFGYDVNGWNSAYSNSIKAAASASLDLAACAGPGAWNDPDALIGTAPSAAVHMSQKQSRTQFSLWAAMAAPLEIGSNILNLSDFDLATYKNKEVVAVDQDSAGMQGGVVQQSANCNMDIGTAIDAWTGRTARQRRKRQEAGAPGGAGREGGAAPLRLMDTCTALPDCQQIWARNLSNGDVAVVFVNYTQVLDPSVASATAVAVATAAAPPPKMQLAPCDASQSEQLWKLTATTASGGMTAVQSMASSHAACWEVNGCGYRPGATVDTSYGCKALPAKGVTDPCCSNMAWKVQDEARTLTPAWNESLCFQLRQGGGAELQACDGSSAQIWGLKHAAGAPADEFLVVSGSSADQCIANVQLAAAAAAVGGSSAAGTQDATLVYDVKAMLGWEQAKVRDLWAKKDLGVMRKVTVQLTGDGDSAMYRLSKSE